MKRNIAIVAGGDTSEIVVSLRSAQGIYSFIDKEKYNLYIVEMEGRRWEVQLPDGNKVPVDRNDFSFTNGTEKVVFDFAYITIHGTPGEDGRLQGFFLAPTVTAAALKGAVFAANVYEKLGFAVVPNGTESRHDIIQAVTFGKPEGVIAFCQGIQAAAPVDSFVSPEPWDMPGYDSPVIMAAGAFVQGSSIELSADGPIKPPYAVYFQGGLTWQHAKFGILMSLQKLADAGMVTL